MRNIIIAAAMIVTLTANGFVQANGATQASPTILSAFELMSTAKDLPTDPNHDAI